MNELELQKIVRSELDGRDIEELVHRRWKHGETESIVDPSRMPRKEEYEQIPWVKVDCMHTKLIGRTEDGVGFGLDLFAPRSEEKSPMHRHPHGDRIAAVLEGEGTFFALRGGELVQKDLRPGDVVLFPRNVPHAFWGSDAQPLLIYVVLNPFVEFDRPEHTVKSPEGERALRARGLL